MTLPNLTMRYLPVWADEFAPRWQKPAWMAGAQLAPVLGQLVFYVLGMAGPGASSSGWPTPFTLQAVALLAVAAWAARTPSVHVRNRRARWVVQLPA